MNVNNVSIIKLAKSNGITVLGTGVNPGFVMDALPLVVSGVCQKVERIESVRVVDVSTRRGALQKKVGAGMTVEERHTIYIVAISV